MGEILQYIDATSATEKLLHSIILVGSGSGILIRGDFITTQINYGSIISKNHPNSQGPFRILRYTEPYKELQSILRPFHAILYCDTNTSGVVSNPK